MNLANKITIFRIVLIPFFAEMVLKYNRFPIGEGEIYRWIAVGIFLFAVITDAVDGFVARVTHQITELGKILDPIADKLLLLTGIIILSLQTHLIQLPLWFVITVLSRDIIIVLGALLLHLLQGKVKIAPSLMGKATTVAQMATVLWILTGLGHPQYVWRLAGLLTVASGVMYIREGCRQFSDAPTARPSA